MNSCGEPLYQILQGNFDPFGNTGFVGDVDFLYMMISPSDRVENIVGKGEYAGF